MCGYRPTSIIDDPILPLLLAGQAVCQVHLDVFALDLLGPLALPLPVLVKLRERIPHIIDKELRQLLIVFDHVAEELSKVVVDYATEFLLERESLQVLPLKAASFESVDTVFELIHLLRLFGH